jgi:hypothetical protein
MGKISQQYSYSWGHNPIRRVELTLTVEGIHY